MALRDRSLLATRRSARRTGHRHRQFYALWLGVGALLVLVSAALALSALWPDRTRPSVQASESLHAMSKGAANSLHQVPQPAVRGGKPRPAGRRGVYLNSLAAARTAKIDEVIQKSRALGLNAVVIDIKDNHGVVSYESRVPLAKTIGAATARLKLEELLPKLRAHGLYLIARLVVFYDPKLARFLKSPLEFPWVPATDRRALEYNLAIAEEAAELGFDEIQFDYIRYPDGGTYKPIYDERHEAITSFVRQTWTRIGPKAYLSADVFGRTLWPWNNNKVDPIGQHLESLSPYVDYLSPMVYPSHYDTDELRRDPYGTIQLALKAGLKRELRLRPFLQAFEMKIPETMSYAEYIAAQIRAAQELSFDGYLFWNPQSNYETLWAVLARLHSNK